MKGKPAVHNDPIVDYGNQSVILDTILVETTSNKLGNYTPLEPGAPYPKGTHTAQQLTAFEGNEFLGQKATGDDENIRRSFGKVPSTQDIANWEESFEAESNAHPAFLRRYLEKRDSYAPRVKGTPLPGLYRINVTAAGSGYTAPPVISFTGGTGSGASAIAVLNNSGGIAKIILKAEGTYTVVPTVVITPAGGGSGGTATASIQPAGCLLTEEKATDNAQEPYRSLYIVANRLYQTMPGPQLIGRERSVAVRGRTVDTSTQKGFSGNIAVVVDDFIISSVVNPLSSTVDERTTKSIASLPPDEVSGFWDFVGLPTLLFDIVNTIFCNGTQFASLVTNPVKGGGSSVIRKHRKTVSYSNTLPDPDLSASSYATADIEYRGKMIQFSYQNALNDAISYSEDLALTSGGSACAWTEAYSFSATTPSATTFAAGAWYVKSFIVEPFGESMWKSTKIEFYSAAGNPSL